MKSDATVEIESIKRGTIHEVEFTLAAFGLPELDTPGKKSYGGYWKYGFLAVAALTGIMAVLLRRSTRISG